MPQIGSGQVSCGRHGAITLSESSELSVLGGGHRRGLQVSSDRSRCVGGVEVGVAAKTWHDRDGDRLLEQTLPVEIREPGVLGDLLEASSCPDPGLRTSLQTPRGELLGCRRERGTTEQVGRAEGVAVEAVSEGRQATGVEGPVSGEHLVERDSGCEPVGGAAVQVG